jgi:hypothetical protein
LESVCNKLLVWRIRLRGLNGDLHEATRAELEGNYSSKIRSSTTASPAYEWRPSSPRQVYVSEVVDGMAPPGMDSLENQFQSLGLQQEQVMALEHPGNTYENGEERRRY